MLKSQFRLRNQEDFQKVFQKGRSTANRQFVIYVLPKEGQDQLRIGISVSKKLGKAVVRNRIKRLIREALRLNLPLIQWTGDLIVIARGPVAEMSYQEVADSLVHCLKKAKIYGKASTEDQVKGSLKGEKRE